MNISEFHDFKLEDAVKFHDELNPALYDGNNLKPEVREQLLKIAHDFIEFIGLDDLDVKDITLSGSNAGYTYTKHSDVDLHVVVDLSEVCHDDVYKELFTAKKNLYNDKHNIKIHGYDVELYVQDIKQPHVSAGEYSVLKGRWNKLPVKRAADLKERAARAKFQKLVQLAAIALKSNDETLVQTLLDTIKKYRKAGLDAKGELGSENLAFKAFRSQGIIQQLYNHLDDLHGLGLSIEEDYDPNGPPPGPETPPTMPAGTVRVDVSDVYDWYKLGQHISNLDGLGKHDFGQGPPSTIMAFGSEEQEHKYIDALKKTGLKTTDIDPIDPNQPKNMPRQKVDPTFNVNEASGYIPSEKEKNDPRFKTALTVDVKPATMKKSAIAMGLGSISRAGIPQTANPSGKFKR